MWRKISCNFKELNLDITLGGGQSFRWMKLKNGDWTGVIDDLVFTLKQDKGGNLMYYVHNSLDMKSTLIEETPPSKKFKNSKKAISSSDHIINVSLSEAEDILKNFLNLQFELDKHYKIWSEVDENFKKVANQFKGIRILRQNPVENLFSFICSANNNIPRITSMVEKLCSNYGQKILETEERTFYSFPTIERLAHNKVEMKLRELGFGYRAKYINQTAKMLQDSKPLKWLNNLRITPYKEAHEELLTLPGVGAKVADCVCLMSLDKYEAIPVDTHIWQVTVKDYMPHLKETKALTNKIYQQIGDFYRERFGNYAGWANTVLFAADLKMFKKK